MTGIPENRRSGSLKLAEVPPGIERVFDVTPISDIYVYIFSQYFRGRQLVRVKTLTVIFVELCFVRIISTDDCSPCLLVLGFPGRTVS